MVGPMPYTTIRLRTGGNKLQIAVEPDDQVLQGTVAFNTVALYVLKAKTPNGRFIVMA